MATCIRCRRDPCRCEIARDEATPPVSEAEAIELANLARLARIRMEASTLSPAYVLWLESGRSGPEPLVPAHVRSRIRELMAEAERLGR